MKFRPFVISSLLLLCFTVQAQQLTPAGEAALDSYLADAITSTHIPGMVALVVNKNGIIYEKAFGLMDAANNKPMTTNAIFRIARATSVPLLFEPGTRWHYGESTRVLGEIVEAVSGQGLLAFMQARILGPLQMSDTTFDVPAESNGRVVTVHRSDGARLVEAPNPPGAITAPHNGDGGLAGTARDYSRFIRLFLNGGTVDASGQLLAPETIAAMGENHIGSVRVELMQSTNPLLSENFPEGAGVDTFGLGFQRTEAALPDLRSPGSLAWAGIFNTEFWIDPQAEIGAVLMMQFLPFYDAAAIEVLQGFERRIYQNLEQVSE